MAIKEFFKWHGCEAGWEGGGHILRQDGLSSGSAEDMLGRRIRMHVRPGEVQAVRLMEDGSLCPSGLGRLTNSWG